MSKTLLIIPAYNEEANILKTVRSIEKYNQKPGSSRLDFIVINDGSTDKTEEVLSKNNIPHLTHPKNQGIGVTVQSGYKYALKNKFDFAVQFDGDNQHDVAFVEKILAPLRDKSADLVIGSRFVSKSGKKDNFQSSFARRAGIKLISGAIKQKTGVRICDTTSGFRAANSATIKLFAKKYPVRYPEPISTTELILNGGIVAEVPVKMKARDGGKSSIHGLKNITYMVDVLTSILRLSKRKKASSAKKKPISRTE